MLRLALGNEYVEDETILHVAAQNGLGIFCGVLLTKRLDLDSNKRYALFLLCRLIGSFEPPFTAQVIREQVDPSKGDEGGRTALHLTVRYGHERVVKMFLDANSP